VPTRSGQPQREHAHERFEAAAARESSREQRSSSGPTQPERHVQEARDAFFRVVGDSDVIAKPLQQRAIDPGSGSRRSITSRCLQRSSAAARGLYRPLPAVSAALNLCRLAQSSTRFDRVTEWLRRHHDPQS
jgi:hypothetical protein